MTESALQHRDPPPYLFAALTGLMVFAIYAVSIAPTTAFWDTSEYIAAAYVLGIPHPPGNPLFVVLAHVWGALPLAADYAVRINLFAAVTSATSAALWFLVADRWMRDVVPLRWARLAASFAGVLVAATAWTVWNQSTVNEKVYTVSMLSTALVMWLGVHWADDEPGPHRDRYLVLIGYIIALSSTNHLMGVLAGPAVAVYVLATDPGMLLRPWVLFLGLFLALGVSGKWTVLVSGELPEKVALIVVFLMLIGYTLWRDPGEFRRPMLYLAFFAVAVGVSLNYLFLPIRAMQYPAINEGEPTTWNALLEVLNRAQYGKPPLTYRQADLVSQMGNYLQYFNWQFARDWGAVAARTATMLFGLIGLTGAIALWQRDRRAFWASVTLMVTVTVALVFYLNFKYGYSYNVDPSLGPVAREVRERDYFFVVSFAAFGLWIAVGFGELLNVVAEFLRGRTPDRVRYALATPVLGLALVPIFGNHLTATRAHETLARDFARDLLESVEPYGVLITAGDNDTFPLWFAQEVEGIRKDVTLANLSLMNTRWHLQQLRRRVTPEFDREKAASIWKDWKAERPTTPALTLSEKDINEMPEAQIVPSHSGLKIGDVQIAFGHDTLFLSDLMAVFLIKDNLGKRPIYFAWSDADFPDRTLGLSTYMLTQGLVRKLNPTPLEPKAGVVLNRGLGFVDLDRTRDLLFKVYQFDAASRARPRGWVDRPSQSILSLYSVVYGLVGPSFQAAGDSALAIRADSIAQAVDANTKDRGQ
jgi:Protein O-mannosyl-transferase TMEM260-like